MKQKQYENLRELAKAIGTSHTTVRRWIGHPKWTFGPGPWPKSKLNAIKKFRAEWIIPKGREMVREAGAAHLKNEVITTDPEILANKPPDQLAEILSKIRAAGNIIEAEMVLKRIRAYRLWREETQRSGALVDASTIRPQIAGVFSMFRSTVLDVPQRINDSLEDLDGPERLKKLRECMCKLLGELAANFEKLTGVPRGEPLAVMPAPAEMTTTSEAVTTLSK